MMSRGLFGCLAREREGQGGREREREGMNPSLQIKRVGSSR